MPKRPKEFFKSGFSDRKGTSINPNDPSMNERTVGNGVRTIRTSNLSIIVHNYSVFAPRIAPSDPTISMIILVRTRYGSSSFGAN